MPAKLFLAFLYSDTACEIFANATSAEGKPTPAIQPVLGIADKLTGDNAMFYSIYDNGAKAAMGNFAPLTQSPALKFPVYSLSPINSLVSGNLTVGSVDN